MIHVYGLPQMPFLLAFSGGCDSVAAAHFLHLGRHNFELLYVNHLTPFGQNSLDFVQSFAQDIGKKITIREISPDKPKGESCEEFWRNERLRIFKEFQRPVVTAHHLDDVLETWIFSSLHGEGKIIPYQNGNVVRPFLRTKREDFKDYLTRRKLSWLEDPSNIDTKYMRNLIRHKIVPEALAVNPGLYKTMNKKTKAMYDGINKKETSLENFINLRKKML